MGRFGVRSGETSERRGVRDKGRVTKGETEGERRKEIDRG